VVSLVPIIARRPDVTEERSAMDPTRELVGYAEVERRVIVREKHLSISGRENKPPVAGRPPEEIWRVDVTIADEKGDLRSYLPLLASVAMDMIGRNTHGTVTLSLRSDDEAIRFIRKGL
jgi:hypothetical protein